MIAAPVHSERRATVENWTEAPFNRWSFRNLERILPTAVIGRGAGPPAALALDLQPLGEIQYTAGDGRLCSVATLLDASHTDGLLVLHRKRIVYEELRDGFAVDGRHIAFSVSKSVVGTLAGILMAQGAFGRGDSVTSIIPELTSSGWDGATVAQVLNMTTSADFVEDYEDRSGSVWAMRSFLYGLPDDSGRPNLQGILKYLPTVGSAGRHGDAFVYKSADTMVLAWILERTTGRQLPELIESEIWSQLGMDHDARIMLDPTGVAYGAGGICAAIRDLGRFGLMVANGGAFNGRQVAPDEWIEACRTGDKEKFGASTLAERFPNGAYANHWWLQHGDGGPQLAIGIHGQMIYIDRRREMVAVKLSCWPRARMLDTLTDTISALEAIAAELQE